MIFHWAKTPIARARSLGLAVSLSITLGLAGAGCGGGSGDSGESVIRPDPSVEINKGAPAPSVAKTDGTTPSATTDTGKTSTPAAAPVKSEGWGTLKGQIVFGGNPPTPSELVPQGKAPKNPEYCAKDGPIKSERLVVDPATKGVKFALVYLPKPTAVNEEAKSKAATTPVVFDQVKCVFEPHVIGMMNGATVELKSSDSVGHNVNARLRVQSFNQTVAPLGKLPFKPSGPERQPAEVTCDIHNWMKAYWMVLDNPYFAVTDEKGNFEIKNVPAGTQKVVVWQEAVSFVTPTSGVDVTITPGADTTKSFTIDPGKVKGEN
jgi:plastocyanin